MTKTKSAEAEPAERENAVQDSDSGVAMASAMEDGGGGAGDEQDTLKREDEPGDNNQTLNNVENRDNAPSGPSAANIHPNPAPAPQPAAIHQAYDHDELAMPPRHLPMVSIRHCPIPVEDSVTLKAARLLEGVEQRPTREFGGASAKLLAMLATVSPRLSAPDGRVGCGMGW
ncbi:hypothetical protein HGRIS_004109 [Hohenbuehelia grisea]|uniref:Uncharacterized protein n=1 Tax=Hohenbuehelia grisea TaxID=104357 RepID=A0ABR3JHH5_9AGAR